MILYMKQREAPSKLGRKCTCGSGQHEYRLFDAKGRFVMCCCHACEKTRRQELQQIRQQEQEGIKS